MEIRYYLADPTGNITVLVSSPVDEEMKPEVNAMLMKKEPSAEQLGFLSEGVDGADIELNMAGGEFCGNASLSAAAIYAGRNGLREADVMLKTSGVEGLVKVSLTGDGATSYTGCISMPLPEGIFEIDGFKIVKFKGIAHAVYEGRLDSAEAEKTAETLCERLDADAFGIMQLDMTEGTILPYVYVPKAGTGFWESSCASGTAAVGYYCYYNKKCTYFEKEFSEPKGRLKISFDGKELLLTGNISFGKEKSEVL
jgi:hypothetical protein